MTSRATLHALIDALPDEALPEAESRLRALDEPAIASAADRAENGVNGAAQHRPEPVPGWTDLGPPPSEEEIQRILTEAAARGDALAKAFLKAEPLGPEFNSERPHDLAGRGDNWFADDDAE